MVQRIEDDEGLRAADFRRDARAATASREPHAESATLGQFEHGQRILRARELDEQGELLVDRAEKDLPRGLGRLVLLSWCRDATAGRITARSLPARRGSGRSVLLLLFLLFRSSHLGILEGEADPMTGGSPGGGSREVSRQMPAQGRLLAQEGGARLGKQPRARGTCSTEQSRTTRGHEAQRPHSPLPQLSEHRIVNGARIGGGQECRLGAAGLSASRLRSHERIDQPGGEDAASMFDALGVLWDRDGRPQLLDEAVLHEDLARLEHAAEPVMEGGRADDHEPLPLRGGLVRGITGAGGARRQGGEQGDDGWAWQAGLRRVIMNRTARGRRRLSLSSREFDPRPPNDCGACKVALTVAANPVDLMSPEGISRLEAAWEGHADRMVGLLTQLVDHCSYSDLPEGVDAVRRLLVPQFVLVGCQVEEVSRPPSGGARARAAHLVARRPAPGATRVLLIGHLDTVHPPGVGRQQLERDGDVLRGPGVGDIKGGVVAILGAMQLLSDLGLADCADITVFLNSDEEVGSHCSRDLLREIAGGCDVALGFEPAFCPPGDAVEAPSRVQHVIERKGCGRMEFRLRGVAAHAGGAHHLGVSAVEAMARKVVEIHALTDDVRGVTTNVGIVRAGRAANTVAPEARAEVDFRYRNWDDGRETWRRLVEIVARPERVNPRVETAVTAEIEPGGGALWPPLIPNDGSRRLSGLILELATRLGFEGEAIARGGASDAAHAAAAGLPAICGLGPVSIGIHTDDERSSVSGLRRSALHGAAILAALSRWKESS